MKQVGLRERNGIQYLVLAGVQPGPQAHLAQSPKHFPKWLSPQDAWPCDRWRRHGHCPRQFREEVLPSCSLLQQCSGLGQWTGRGALRSVRPTGHLGARVSVGVLLKRARPGGCANPCKKWIRQESCGPRGAVGTVQGHCGPAGHNKNHNSWCLQSIHCVRGQC